MWLEETTPTLRCVQAFPWALLLPLSCLHLRLTLPNKSHSASCWLTLRGFSMVKDLSFTWAECLERSYQAATGACTEPTSHAPPLPCPTAADVEWQGWPTMSTWAKRTFPSLFYFISFSRVSLISGWPQSHYVVEDGFVLLILPPPSEFRDYWHVPPQPVWLGKYLALQPWVPSPEFRCWGVMPAISAFGRQRQLEFPRQPTKTTRWVTGH